jgi:hypothetical protein
VSIYHRALVNLTPSALATATYITSSALKEGPKTVFGFGKAPSGRTLLIHRNTPCTCGVHFSASASLISRLAISARSFRSGNGGGGIGFWFLGNAVSSWSANASRVSKGALVSVSPDDDDADALTKLRVLTRDPVTTRRLPCQPEPRKHTVTKLRVWRLAVAMLAVETRVVRSDNRARRASSAGMRSESFSSKQKQK